MRITINFYLNDDNAKDKQLLDWLNDQTNRSAFIRMKLYELMVKNGGDIQTIKPIEQVAISDGFMNSIGGLI